MAGHWDHFIRYCWCGWHAAVDEEPVEPTCPSCLQKPVLQTKSSSLDGLQLWLAIFLDPAPAIEHMQSMTLSLRDLPHNASRRDTLYFTGWLQEQSGQPLDPGDVAVNMANGRARLVGVTRRGSQAINAWASKHEHEPPDYGQPAGEKSS